MKHSYHLLFLIFSSGVLAFDINSFAGNLPLDIFSALDGYDEVWTFPSTNESPGSMLAGNGDITVNVWAENNGGDLMMYIGKSDSRAENTGLLKVGRTRIHFSPNPFVVGTPFSKTLDFYHGEIDITAGQSDSQINLLPLGLSGKLT